MADIAISYAHCDVDDAIALRASLLAIGCTVWMDDPGENADASSTGIPVGRAHWEVIEKELAAALQIVVIDRLEWRTREYCQKEYRLCQSLGKSIILLTPNDLVTAAPQISATIAANERVLAAHARLASRALSPRERHSWLQRIVFQRAAHDAELVTTAHPGAGVEMTPLLREVAEEEIRTAQNTRRRLRSIGTQIVSGLLVLAVLAGIAWRLSSGWSREAVSAERAAEALELASQSSTAVDTVRGVSLAEQAVKHDPSPLIHQALTAAKIRDKRLRQIELPPDDYTGASWAAQAPLILAYSAFRVTVIDTETGKLHQPIAAPGEIKQNRLVSGPSGVTAVYVDSDSNLRWLDVIDGKTVTIAQGPVTALSITGDSQLLWTTQTGKLHSAPYPEDGNLGFTATSTSLPSAAHAVDGVGKTVVVLDDNGWARRLQISGNDFTENAAVQISEDHYPETTSGYRASITLCDNTAFGSFVPKMLGMSFRWQPDGGSELATEKTTQRSAALCTEDNALTASATQGPITDFSGETMLTMPDDLVRFISVRDPLHTRTAHLSPSPSRLLVSNIDTAVTQRSLGIMHALLPMAESTLGVDENLEVVDLASHASHGRVLDAAPYAELVAIIGCNALLPSGTAVHHLGCDKSLTRIASSEDLAGVRAAVDGTHFVVSYSSRIIIFRLDGTIEQEISLDWLGQDAVAEADLSPDGSTVAIVTILGHVYELPVDRATEPSEPLIEVPAGNFNTVAYLPDGESLLVLGADSRLLRYDGSKNLVNAHQLGFRAEALFVSNGTVFASSFTKGTKILDAGTLTPLEHVQMGFLLPGSSSSPQILGLLQFHNDEGGTGGSRLVTVPRIK